MYILSAVLEDNRCSAALISEEYGLISKKSGSCSEVNDICRSLLNEKGIKDEEIKYFGIAAASSYGNPEDLASQIESKSGFKCYGTSLISARALGEAYSAGDLPYLTLLKIDDVVECGLVIDKKVFAGIHQLGGRVGHSVINFDGYECTCGRKGCFEAYVSTAGLKRIMAESGVAGDVTCKELFSMDTPEAKRAMELYIKYLVNGITNVINLFQPNELVLEGFFTEVGDELMGPLVEKILSEQYTRSVPNKSNIRFANKSEDIALIGAALLGR